MLKMLSAVVCVLLTIWSLASPAIGLTVWIATIWGVGVFLYAMHSFAKPSPALARRFFLGDEPGSLSETEIGTFLRYHSWFTHPLAAVEFASALSVLRVSGLVAAIGCLITGRYILAVIAVFGFFAFGPLSVTLHPLSWLNPQALEGHPYAVQQKAIVQRLLEMRMDREAEGRKAFADKRLEEAQGKRDNGQITSEQYDREKLSIERFAARTPPVGGNQQAQEATSAAVDQVIAAGWKPLLSNPDVSEDIKTPILEVLIPLRVYAHRFIDNMIFIENDGMTFTLPAGTRKPMPTPSLARSRSRAEWPMGHPLWFIAAFPDVVHWVSETIAKANLNRQPEAEALMEKRNEKIVKLLQQHGLTEDSGETEVLNVLQDVHGKTSPQQGRLLAEWYKESTGRVFETGVP